jgi:hypothetical protein
MNWLLPYRGDVPASAPAPTPNVSVTAPLEVTLAPAPRTAPPPPLRGQLCPAILLIGKADLETLVKGVQVGAQADHKTRFLRKIPIDPMTGQAEWNYEAIQDDPDSTSWSGKNVFDVHSKSQAIALDGTKYSDW